VQYCQVNTASAEVTGVPSDHTRPGFSFQVIVVRSSETPPFCTVGMSSARKGTRTPPASNRAIGSITRLAASMSLVPPDR